MGWEFILVCFYSSFILLFVSLSYSKNSTSKAIVKGERRGGRGRRGMGFSPYCIVFLIAKLNVSTTKWQRVVWFIKAKPQTYVSESRWEGGDGFVEITYKGQMGEGGWEGVNWLVKVASKNEMGETGREEVD